MIVIDDNDVRLVKLCGNKYFEQLYEEMLEKIPDNKERFKKSCIIKDKIEEYLIQLQKIDEMDINLSYEQISQKLIKILEDVLE